MTASTLLRSADHVLCIKEITRLAQAPEVEAVETLAVNVGFALQRFRAEFIPVEYAEMLLTSVARLTEAVPIEGFAKCDRFVRALVDIVEDCGHALLLRDSELRHLRSDQYGDVLQSAIKSASSYCSHYCYELALYITLGVIERTGLLSEVVAAVDQSDIIRLLNSIARVLPRDLLYLTQEMGLEVIARFSYYYINRDRTFLEGLLKTMLPPIIATKLTESGQQIIKLLKDMRPVLKALNIDNKNIFSAHIISAAYQFGNEYRLFPSVTWLDLCHDSMCFHITDLQQFIRIDYSLIGKFSVDDDNRLLKLFLPDPPMRLIEAIKKQQRMPDDVQDVQLEFCLETSVDIDTARAFITEKRQLLDEQLSPKALPNKFSVATTKAVVSNSVAKAKGADTADDKTGTTLPYDDISTVSSPDMKSGSDHKVAEAKAMRRLTMEHQDSLIRTSSRKAAPTAKDVKLVKATSAASKVTRRKRKSNPPVYNAKKRARQSKSAMEFGALDYSVPNDADEPSSRHETPAKISKDLSSTARMRRPNSHQPSRAPRELAEQPPTSIGAQTSPLVAEHDERDSAREKENIRNLAMDSERERSYWFPPTANITHLSVSALPSEMSHRISASRTLQQPSIFYDAGDRTPHESSVRGARKVDDVHTEQHNHSHLYFAERSLLIDSQPAFTEFAAHSAVSERYEQKAHDSSRHSILPNDKSFMVDEDAMGQAEMVEQHVRTSKISDAFEAPSSRGKGEITLPLLSESRQKTADVENTSKDLKVSKRHRCQDFLRQLEFALTKSAGKARKSSQDLLAALSQRISAEVEDDDSVEADEASDVKLYFDLTPKNTEITSSADEDSILSSLIKEIVALQKDRVLKKRKKQMMNICANAKAQFSTFIGEWKKYFDQLHADHNRVMKVQMSSVVDVANNILEGMSKQLQEMQQAEKEVEQSLTLLRGNILVYSAEGEHLKHQVNDDMMRLKEELKRLRLSAINKVRRSITNTSKTGSKQKRV